MPFIFTKCNRLHTLVSCQHAQHTQCAHSTMFTRLHSNRIQAEFKQQSHFFSKHLQELKNLFSFIKSLPNSFLNLLCTTDSHTLVLQWMWGHLLPHWSSGWVWLIWLARRGLPSLLTASMCIPPKTVHLVKDCTKYFYSQNKGGPVFKGTGVAALPARISKQALKVHLISFSNQLVNTVSQEEGLNARHPPPTPPLWWKQGFAL